MNLTNQSPSSFRSVYAGAGLPTLFPVPLSFGHDATACATDTTACPSPWSVSTGSLYARIADAAFTEGPVRYSGVTVFRSQNMGIASMEG